MRIINNIEDKNVRNEFENVYKHLDALNEAITSLTKAVDAMKTTIGDIEVSND